MLRSAALCASLLVLPWTGCDSGAPAKSEPAKKEAGKAAAKTDPPVKADPKADPKAEKADTKADAKPDPAKPTTDVAAKPTGGKQTWNFDDLAAGAKPAGFQISQTGEEAPPAKWGATTHDDAPSGTMAFGITENAGTNKVYHLALAEGTSYGDVELDVMIKSGKGENNRGGGVVFRAKGPNDYYVARWNPVENNFRIYALLGGARVDIASAPLEVEEDAWHHLKVTMVGDTITCTLDDQPVATAKDKSLPDAGMVGIWAKGDAVTAFDDFSVAPAAP